MLERMIISGFGPHRDFTAEFNPTGITVVSGPSEAGKTSILEAITFCLWGRAHGGKFGPEAIHEGMPKTLVEIALDSGRIISRSFTQSKTQRRSITMGEQTQNYTTEAAFAEALGDLGRDTDALRLVLIPFEWVPMVEGNARPFRDLLARLLPEANVGAEVEKLMAEKGYALDPGEADQSEKDVMSLRSSARKTKDEAAGRLAAAEERLALLATTEPRLADGRSLDSRLRDTLQQAASAWAEYDKLTGGHTGISEAAEWDQRKAALGEEPPWDPAWEGADQRLQQAQLAASQHSAAYQQAYGQNQTALAQLQQLQGSSLQAGVCPTCQRAGWEAGQQYLMQLLDYQGKAQEAFEAAQARYQAAQQDLERATAIAVQAREGELRRRTWQEGRARLGSRPVVADQGSSDKLPPPPSTPRPDPELLRQLATLEGARRQWQADFEGAQLTLQREQERLTEATKIYDRLSDLLEAVRAAPSVVAARQALSLGDLGPVTFEFGENPAVKVNIDGRPWWLASRGRQVVADMYLRGAIRRVLDKEWLPIVVDNVQDVGGQPLPDLEGPVVLLVTNDEQGIRVERK
jgi:hypothetical protein